MTTETSVTATNVQARRNLGAAYLALKQAEATLAVVRARYEAAVKEVRA